MINLSLQVFCNRIVAAGRITHQDVRALTRHVLPDGLTSRDEADMLIALDRCVTATDDAFADYLVASVVDFAVWGERPTGYIDADVARWLVASLRNGSGPTLVAARIARCLAQAELGPERIDALFLTGGSTGLPHLRAALTAALPAARVVEGDTFGSVGLGLTIEAARRAG